MGYTPKSITPEQARKLVLAECDSEQVDSYTRFCTILTAYAESDFNVNATQGTSVGVFQQTLPWWTNDRLDVRQATRAFIRDFASKAGTHTGKPVIDCWFTQQWAAPDPRLDLAGFLAAKETINYSRRLVDVPGLLK